MKPLALASAIVKGIAPAVRDYVQLQLRGSAEKIASLETRVQALEQRPQLKYGGIYHPGAGYEEGALVTKGGGLWLATRATNLRPGEDHNAWRLIVKSGGAR